MSCPHLIRWLAVGAAVAGLIISQGVPQTARAQPNVRGNGRGLTQEVQPCFHTDIPAHPYDVILGQPTATSVVVSTMSSTDAEGLIEWGTASGQYTGRTKVVKLPAGEPVATTLTDLTPDTQYVYRLQHGAGGADLTAGLECRFHTQRASGRAFTFTITADSHLDEFTNTDLYANTLRNALADTPDFHVDLGDTFMSDKVRALGQPIAPMYTAQRYYLGLLCQSAPLFFVTGNHDGEIALQDPEARALRLKMLPNPFASGFYSGNDGTGLGNCYAWTWGDALFIVLDPFTYTTGRIRTANDNWSRTLGEAQYRWLQQTLACSSASLKFVFIHHLTGGLDRNGRGGSEAAPYFEWGGRDLDGSDQFSMKRVGWERPIHQLLVKWGVTAVFHGHDHFYARQELDGIVYQGVPQPGWIGGARVNQAAEYGYSSGRILPSSGHLRVKVDPAGATVDYIRSVLPAQPLPNGFNRTVAFSYRLAWLDVEQVHGEAQLPAGVAQDGVQLRSTSPGSGGCYRRQGYVSTEPPPPASVPNRRLAIRAAVAGSCPGPPNQPVACRSREWTGARHRA